MKKYFTCLLILVSFLSFAGNVGEGTSEKEGYATVSGYIKDEKGEDLIGANVFVKNNSFGTVSNIYGFYSLTLPKGEYIISYSFIGYDAIEHKVKLNDNKNIDVKLEPSTQSIAEVSISAVKKDANVSAVGMSMVKLQARQIKKIPVLFGERDVIKTIQLLPGVQTMGEGNSGFYVRGGAVDQNLIILDDANVFSPSHIGGIFSVFNGDAIKNVELYKGGIPASYGGRLSSVLDIRMKEGNMTQLTGDGGIGAISSRMTLEGPIIRDKSSFLISGRRTYVDLFFPFFNNDGLKNSRMYFYDLNGKVNWVVNDNNRVFISAYAGNDIAKLDSFFQFEYGNVTFTARWNHVYNNRLFSNLSLIYSDYDYSIGQPEGLNAFQWTANIVNQSIKNDYTYYLNPNNTIRFGFQTIYHTIKPGTITTEETSFFNIDPMRYKYGIENSIFLENEQKLGEKISLRYGLRISSLHNVGEDMFFTYEEQPGGKLVAVDSTFKKKGELFNPNYGLEPRISVRYLLNPVSSVKASYDRTYQYIHLSTNTASSTPFDLWFLSNPNIKPQYADQVAAGYFRNFANNVIETSVEVYYKKMNNSIDFIDHAQLFLNEKLDAELRAGGAYSYGAEFFIRKQQGDFTGWVSYTFSKTRREIDGINDGEEYNAPYAKPHDFKLVGIYDINKRITIAANWVYASPLSYTLAKEWYKHENLWVPVYTKRNEVRLKGTDYHRLDLSFTYNFNKKGKFESSLQASIYNAYNRHNLYSILYEQPKDGNSPPEMKKMFLFGVIPTLSYNFKF